MTKLLLNGGHNPALVILTQIFDFFRSQLVNNDPMPHGSIPIAESRIGCSSRKAEPHFRHFRRDWQSE
jgi:hypothetical protein